MPRQVTNVAVRDNGDDTASITVGLFEFTKYKAALFDRTPNHDLIRNNLRLAFQIGGYAEPASQEFKDAVNKGGRGMEGTDGRYKIESVLLVDAQDEIYDIKFTDRTGQTFTMPIRKSDLFQEWDDVSIVVENLVPFLRVGGFAELTTAAIAQVRVARFWY